jgi:hypothetical protein
VAGYFPLSQTSPHHSEPPGIGRRTVSISGDQVSSPSQMVPTQKEPHPCGNDSVSGNNCESHGGRKLGLRRATVPGRFFGEWVSWVEVGASGLRFRAKGCPKCPTRIVWQIARGHRPDSADSFSPGKAME